MLWLVLKLAVIDFSIKTDLDIDILVWSIFRDRFGTFDQRVWYICSAHDIWNRIIELRHGWTSARILKNFRNFGTSHFLRHTLSFYMVPKSTAWCRSYFRAEITRAEHRLPLTNLDALLEITLWYRLRLCPKEGFRHNSRNTSFIRNTAPIDRSNTILTQLGLTLLLIRSFSWIWWRYWIQYKHLICHFYHQ